MNLQVKLGGRLDVSDESEVLFRGDSRTIAFARTKDGACPAREFWEGSELPNKDYAALQRVMDWMAKTGKVHNKEKFKKVEGHIFEFKSYQARIGCFWDPAQPGVLRLTHGFIKKKKRWPKQELERACRIRDEHMATREE